MGPRISNRGLDPIAVGLPKPDLVEFLKKYVRFVLRGCARPDIRRIRGPETAVIQSATRRLWAIAPTFGLPGSTADHAARGVGATLAAEQQTDTDRTANNTTRRIFPTMRGHMVHVATGLANEERPHRAAVSGFLTCFAGRMIVTSHAGGGFSRKRARSDVANVLLLRSPPPKSPPPSAPPPPPLSTMKHIFYYTDGN
ncbi:hypothetical protein QTP88_013675 [Uroleucon formosanum]